MWDQWLVFGVLALTLILFMEGTWRYDLVALIALLTLILSGVIAPDNAFTGFAHPAVVTVAAVLVVSRGLSNAGAVNLVAGWLALVPSHTTAQVMALTCVVAVCSAFMNNVGALALLMPVAIRMARENSKPASVLLMPLAFGSLLGGMATLIGTPPNIIIAMFRAEQGREPFAMFSFAPVGSSVALAGILFISLVGWRLLPQRKGEAAPDELFEIKDYLTEVLVPEQSKLAGRMLRDIKEISDADISIIGFVRDDQRLPIYSGYDAIHVGDILIVEGDSEALKQFADDAGLELAGSQSLADAFIKSKDIHVAEAVVLPGSRMVGQTARSLNLRVHHGLNLLAVARQGQRIRERLASIRFKEGDVLLWEGPPASIQEALADLQCLPLAERELTIGQPRRLLIALALFVIAIGCMVMNILPTQIALMTAAVLMIVFGIVPLRQIYTSIDWPVIVLLGAMIPVGQAMDDTGGAAWIADQLLAWGTSRPPGFSLAALFVVTTLLSNAINNAAAAFLMAPIGLALAHGLDVNADPFLMTVAIAASCAFLTPIGHQSNTLVMGPGGYRFGDYWRLGLPLQIIILILAIPLLLWIWPM
jgi:di/tricarboxylate transporter